MNYPAVLRTSYGLPTTGGYILCLSYLNRRMPLNATLCIVHSTFPSRYYVRIGIKKNKKKICESTICKRCYYTRGRVHSPQTAVFGRFCT